MSFLNKNNFILVVIVLSVFMFSGYFSFCLAQNNQLGGLENTAGGIGYQQISGSTDVKISSWIGMIAKSVIGFIGIIFMVLVFMGAFDIVGAGGNDEMVKKGKDKIKNGAIGVLIVFAAYLLTNTILVLATGGEGGIFTF
jgi:hypothetical protein